MMEADKIRMTKQGIKLVRAGYSRLKTEREMLNGSAGLTAVWGREGGRSGRVSKPTQTRALKAIELDGEEALLLRWADCLRGTLSRLKDSEGKTRNRRRHDLIVARALQLYAFQRADMDTMRALSGGCVPVSEAHVKRLLNEAVTAAMAQAESAGLFDGAEAICHSEAKEAV